MKLIKKIKDWRDRRFQKRVFKAWGLDKPLQTDIQSCDPYFLINDGTMHGKLTSIPTLNIDEIHNAENGHPV